MTPEIMRVISRQEAERFYSENHISYPIQTTDATPTIAVTVELNDYEGGFIEVEVIAVMDNGGGKYSGKSITGVFKDTALVLDLPSVIHDEDGIGGASYQVIDDSDNPAVEITGVAATTINWIVRVNKFVTQATSIP